jgi:hypothetical protein
MEFVKTEYSHMSTEELLGFTLVHPGASSHAIELAQRLMLAVDMLGETDGGNT